MELEKLRGPLRELHIFRLFQEYGEDVHAAEREPELVEAIEKLRAERAKLKG